MQTNESLELSRVLRGFLYSYPVSSQLRETSFLDKKDSNAFEQAIATFRTGGKTGRSYKLDYVDYEQDKQTSLALAFFIITKFEPGEDPKTSLDKVVPSTHLFVNYSKQLTNDFFKHYYTF